uniref:Uncharacterized protein n=1 Tax=Leersia perrieri TaxID=77586 RepID=A0A0D9VK27_9ORYZ
MSSSSSCAVAAEATGLVAMDCLVVCCCCPCLVLQITVFLFVRLPKKVVIKSKRIILRRWHRRRSSSSSSAAKRSGCSSTAVDGDDDPAVGVTTFDDVDDLFEGAFGDDGEGWWRERCFVAVDDNDDDGVWEALIEQRGLFWFGSFWGRSERVDRRQEFGDELLHPALRFPLVLERACDQ